MIDRIETNVESAKDYVEDAERKINRAREYTSKYRRVRSLVNNKVSKK